MKYILEKLYQKKTLTKEETYHLFKLIAMNKISKVHLTAILISIKIRGESSDEIIGAVQALLEQSVFFPRPKYLFADVVGTGGDGNSSINISTTSAIVASACGFKIAKHCNKSITSHSGSANLLQSFGINLYKTPNESLTSLNKFNICFLFAPQYNTSFKHCNGIRKELNTSTIFNTLGPLLNPSIPPLAVIGVRSSILLLPVVKALKFLGYKRAIVLCTNEIDEITLQNNTAVAELYKEQIFQYYLKPQDFGLSTQSRTILQNYTVQENLEIISNIFKGNGVPEYENIIAANVAIILKIFGKNCLKENTQLALDMIKSGKVYTHIKSLIKQG